jgi:O-antigen ligase
LSLNAIFQFLNESSIFHFVGTRDEHYGFKVAGGYTQKFFIFPLILIPVIWKKLDKQKFLISTVLSIIFFSGILFSGSRMSLAMFCFSILLTIILIKELRFSLAIASLFCVLIFTTSIKVNDNLRASYKSFYQNASSMMANMKKYVPKKYPELEKRKEEFFYFSNKYMENKKLQSRYEMPAFGSGHFVLYLTAIDVWIDNPIIGNGIKSFRIKCLTKLHLPGRVCQSHPHNYYLELLNDTGLLGTLFLVCAIFYLITNKFFNFKYYEKNDKFLFICLLIIIIAEFFPLRSSGSFFSTAGSSFIFLILGMLNGLKKIKE